MGGVSHLADQMEKNLAISDEFVASDPPPPHIHSVTDNPYITEKSRMSPVVQRILGHENGRGLPSPAYGYSIQPGMDQPIVSPTAGAPPPGSFLPGGMSAEGEQHLSYQSQLRERPEGHQILSHLQPHPHHPHHPGLVQPQGHHPQGMFSHSGNVTPQPVQILGHSLSTTIFSPPPSAGPGPPTMFYSPGTSKLSHGGTSPAHAPVGSGVKFKKFNSPKQQLPRSEIPMGPQSPQATHQAPPPMSMVEQQQQQRMHTVPLAVVASNDQSIVVQDGMVSPQQLPPRLNQKGGGGGGGTRYQNQRHPSNRNTLKGEGYVGGSVQGPPTYPSQARREPLLPTPNEMIKLDTGITGKSLFSLSPDYCDLFSLE